MVNEEKTDLHLVWEHIAMKKFKRAAKIYVQSIRANKSYLFVIHKPEDTKSLDNIKKGLFNVLKTLDSDLKSRSFTGDKAKKFKEAVINEIQRLMKGHALGIKGYLKVAKAAKTASKINLKEDIVKYSLF